MQGILTKTPIHFTFLRKANNGTPKIDTTIYCVRFFTFGRKKSDILHRSLLLLHCYCLFSFVIRYDRYRFHHLYVSENFVLQKNPSALGKIDDNEKKGKSRGNPAFSFLGRSCIEKGAAFFAADLINKDL